MTARPAQRTTPSQRTTPAQRALDAALETVASAGYRLHRRAAAPVHNRRGFALLWALVVFAVLSVSVVEFLSATRINYAIAVRQADDVRAYFNARSGVHMQILGLLFQGELERDPFMGQAVQRSNFQIWEVMSYILPLFTSGELTTPLGAVALRQGPEDAPQVGRIDYGRPEPEEGKINLNAFATTNLSTDLLLRFCHMIAPPQWDRSMNMDQRRALQDRFDVIAAIIDHVDPDDDMTTLDENCVPGVGGRGNESSRYRNVPWQSKNQPFVTLDELRMVPGVTESFMQQFAPKLTVYPIGSNRILINQADATILLGFLCGHMQGTQGTGFSPCSNPQIGYEVGRLALALEGYIRFFQDPFNVISFYMGGMGAQLGTGGGMAEGMGMGQMQAFRRPQQLEAIVRSIMQNPQFELMFMGYARRTTLESFELTAALNSAQQGILPPFQLRPESFDFQRMARNISTDTPKVFSLEATGEMRQSRRTIRAVVDMSSSKPRMLYWREW